ncbi:hypothetical protein EZS27_000843, partial [termite gut metagenome]
MNEPIYPSFYRKAALLNEEIFTSLRLNNITLSKTESAKIVGGRTMLDGVQHEFIIDEFNLPVIHQFYYYLTSDRTLCKLDIDKGIYLMGKVGCGKSLLMSAHLFVQDA